MENAWVCDSPTLYSSLHAKAAKPTLTIHIGKKHILAIRARVFNTVRVEKYKSPFFASMQDIRITKTVIMGINEHNQMYDMDTGYASSP